MHGFNKLTMAPKKFGVIGFPIKHSLSPAMHNAAYKSLGMDYQYRAYEVKPEELGDFISSAKAGGFAGLNVTIPHKVSAVVHMDELSSEAHLIGAVNTIKFGKKTTGYNTDGIGCIRAIRQAGHEVKGKRVFIVGAGGAARAIAFQLALEGANVSITNRQEEIAMAEKLANEINEKLGGGVSVIEFSGTLLQKELKKCDIMIHATPVGMHPHVDASMIPVELIPKNVVVMDIVYNPFETKLLRDAKANGCKTISGDGMLVNQGAESFKIWLGVEPPVDVMRKALLKRLITH